MGAAGMCLGVAAWARAGPGVAAGHVMAGYEGAEEKGAGVCGWRSLTPPSPPSLHPLPPSPPFLYPRYTSSARNAWVKHTSGCIFAVYLTQMFRPKTLGETYIRLPARVYIRSALSTSPHTAQPTRPGPRDPSWPSFSRPAGTFQSLGDISRQWCRWWGGGEATT